MPGYASVACTLLLLSLSSWESAARVASPEEKGTGVKRYRRSLRQINVDIMSSGNGFDPLPVVSQQQSQNEPPPLPPLPPVMQQAQGNGDSSSESEIFYYKEMLPVPAPEPEMESSMLIEDQSRGLEDTKEIEAAKQEDSVIFTDEGPVPAPAGSILDILGIDGGNATEGITPDANGPSEEKAVEFADNVPSDTDGNEGVSISELVGNTIGSSQGILEPPGPEPTPSEDGLTSISDLVESAVSLEASIDAVPEPSVAPTPSEDSLTSISDLVESAVSLEPSMDPTPEPAPVPEPSSLGSSSSPNIFDLVRSRPQPEPAPLPEPFMDSEPEPEPSRNPAPDEENPLLISELVNAVTKMQPSVEPSPESMFGDQMSVPEPTSDLGESISPTLESNSGAQIISEPLQEQQAEWLKDPDLYTNFTGKKLGQYERTEWYTQGPVNASDIAASAPTGACKSVGEVLDQIPEASLWSKLLQDAGLERVLLNDKQAQATIIVPVDSSFLEPINGEPLVNESTIGELIVNSPDIINSLAGAAGMPMFFFASLEDMNMSCGQLHLNCVDFYYILYYFCSLARSLAQ